jgi:hypothetical protein
MGAVGDAIAEAQIAVSESAADIMPFTCTVSTPGTPTNNGDGTFSEGAPTTIEDVPCDYGPLSSYERLAGGALAAGASYWLEFPVYWDGGYLSIPANAMAEVEAGAVMPAKTFQVVGPLSSKSVWKQRVAATEG